MTHGDAAHFKRSRTGRRNLEVLARRTCPDGEPVERKAPRLVGFSLRVLVLTAAVALGGVGNQAVAAGRVAPDTVVRLKSGAVYQGVLVESVPGDHVTIQLADGNVKRFGSGAVASIRSLGQRVEEDGPGALVAASHAAAARDEDDANAAPATVDVSLSSTNRDARLFQIAVAGAPGAESRLTTTKREVCGPPCARDLPPGTYQIVGKDLEPSRIFDLETSVPHVKITTDPVLSSRKSTGKALLIGSGVVGSVGLPLLFYGGFFTLALPSDSFSDQRDKWKTVAETGLVLSTVAVAAGIAGLTLYLRDTEVTVASASPGERD